MGCDDICNMVRCCNHEELYALFGLLVVDDGKSEGVLFVCLNTKHLNNVNMDCDY